MKKFRLKKIDKKLESQDDIQHKNVQNQADNVESSQNKVKGLNNKVENSHNIVENSSKYVENVYNKVEKSEIEVEKKKQKVRKLDNKVEKWKGGVENLRNKVENWKVKVESFKIKNETKKKHEDKTDKKIASGIGNDIAIADVKKSKKKGWIYSALSKTKWFSKQEWLVIILVFSLVIFGCIMVYSASSYSALYHYGNEYFFLYKQIFGVVLGTFALFFFAFIDYHILKRFKYWILAVSILLLILVFVPGFGVQSYGANRWVNILGISIQPSEIAKFALVLFLACYLSENHQKIKTFKGLLPALLVAGILCVLVIIEPSMSVTMCLACVTLFMLIIGGMSKKHTIIFSSMGAVAVPVLILAEPYRLKRLFAFLNPWASPQGEGFQLIQSLYGLGNGGWFGVGLFQSRQKYLFLPFAESDFILAIIGEELGYFGCLCLMSVYVVLIYNLFKIGLNAKDRFGCLLACGIGIVIAVQTILNIAVVTGSIPPTGLPLPFISSGGTSVAVFMAGVGVALSVSRNSAKHQ